jgi:site-specific DNA-cytosine methylase
MENVDALRNEKNKPYLNEMLELLQKAGFSYEYTTYDTRLLGLCQKRKRLILVASKSGLKNLLPIYNKEQKAVKFKDILDRYNGTRGKGWQSRTAKEVWSETTIGTALAKGMAGKGMVKYIVPDMATKEIQGMETRAIKLYDDVLPTVTCGWNGGPTRKKVAIIDSDIGGFGIPGIRCPTLIEGMRAQGFPDVWIPTFLNVDKSLAWTMIGNAVPPALSKLIVEHLMKNDFERAKCASGAWTDVLPAKTRQKVELEKNIKSFLAD